MLKHIEKPGRTHEFPGEPWLMVSFGQVPAALVEELSQWRREARDLSADDESICKSLGMPWRILGHESYMNNSSVLESLHLFSKQICRSCLGEEFSYQQCVRLKGGLCKATRFAPAVVPVPCFIVLIVARSPG